MSAPRATAATSTLVGTYDPLVEPAKIKLDAEKIGSWIEEGSPADTDRGQADEAGGRYGLTPAGGSLLDLVDFLARNLVLHPEAVEVKQNVTDQLTTFEVRVHKDDLGRVIGKQGRTAKSLRTVLNAAASRLQQKASLEIIED